MYLFLHSFIFAITAKIIGAVSFIVGYFWVRSVTRGNAKEELFPGTHEE